MLPQNNRHIWLTMVIDHGNINSGYRFKEVYMQSAVISVSKFKATCLGLLKKVQKTGQSILITRKGEVIAIVSPPPPAARPESWLGTYQKSGKIVGDIISPVFDEDEWEASKE
jgi:prevent-host-death family protein